MTFEGDYGRELTMAEDPTLASTHLEQNSTVQCVVAHWSSNLEITLAQLHDPANRSRYTTHNAPIVEFHGSVDGTINISHAYAVRAQYARTGVAYQLHVLEGCAHGAWCYNGKGNCSCVGPSLGPGTGVQGYDDTMDEIALPFVAQSLGLPLL